jgi:hypothetical protein
MTILPWAYGMTWPSFRVWRDSPPGYFGWRLIADAWTGGAASTLASRTVERIGITTYSATYLCQLRAPLDNWWPTSCARWQTRSWAVAFTPSGKVVATVATNVDVTRDTG